MPLTSFSIIAPRQKATTVKTWRLRRKNHHYPHFFLSSAAFPVVKQIYFRGPILLESNEAYFLCRRVSGQRVCQQPRRLTLLGLLRRAAPAARQSTTATSRSKREPPSRR